MQVQEYYEGHREHRGYGYEDEDYETNEECTEHGNCGEYVE